VETLRKDLFGEVDRGRLER
jgi:hypothetical protein